MWKMVYFPKQERNLGLGPLTDGHVPHVKAFHFESEKPDIHPLLQNGSLVYPLSVRTRFWKKLRLLETLPNITSG
jgi:hypothetical protein